MSAVDDDGAGPDEHGDALAFFDRETTDEVAVPIDERARRSSPPPAVSVAPALEIGPALPSISPSAPTRTYRVVESEDAPPSDLLEQMRRSDAPTEEHATVVPVPTRPIPLASATPTQVGLPRIHAPEIARPVEPDRPAPEPEVARATATPDGARRQWRTACPRRLAQGDPALVRGAGAGARRGHDRGRAASLSAIGYGGARWRATG